MRNCIKTHHLADRERVWSDIASAAETGWDFSSRWFSHNATHINRYQIKSIKTWQIVPVDLNAFMCMNARMMASMYEITGKQYNLSVHITQYV
jgi:alpha,alpha-trehalase